MAFTGLATKVYKDPVTVAWSNSIKDDFDWVGVRAIRAWITFDGSTATITSQASIGFSNIIDEGAGNWDLVFSSAYATSNYAWVGDARYNSGTNSLTMICLADSGKAIDRINIESRNTSVTLGDATSVSVIIVHSGAY